jgi:large conductance mechanosensitive channel
MATSQKNAQSSKEKAASAAERRKKAALKAKQAATTSAEHVKGSVGGFLDFIRSQGVIGLAVGLAIGTAAGDTVKKLVEGFINPIVQFIVGSGDKLATATWHVELFGRTADFAWGAALSSAITLLATALVIYWIVNVFKLDKLDKKKS